MNAIQMFFLVIGVAAVSHKVLSILLRIDGR